MDGLILEESAQSNDMVPGTSLDGSEHLSVWDRLTTVRINPVSKKCTTLPILKLDNPYSINFHLSWLGFWVAFLSWFAFSPLIPEAVKNDLKLTQQQIGNSNIISLCSTLLVRVVVGPLVDRFGPRKIMAGLLIVGAIPSGLAGTVTSAQGLYTIRFFIGILGGTFVPCQAWTTAFFDTPVVGRANALVAGWGNAGGGFTFIIMVALYDRLRGDGLSAHSTWRAAFAIVPVPILLFVAIITLKFGTDHPNGNWTDRHSTSFHDEKGSPHTTPRMSDDKEAGVSPGQSKEAARVTINEATYDTTSFHQDGESLSWNLATRVILTPVTWLPSLAYLTSFGYELAIDANLSNVLFGIYNKTKHFDQTRSGYIASVYGLLNVVTRPLGGYMGDLAYRWYGVRGKKYLVLGLGVSQGVTSLAWGLYIDRSTASPSLAVIIVLIVIVGTVDEMANGANFSLVPHCNPCSNGVMTGIVGAMGNLGGVCFALIFRFQAMPFGKAFWIAGVVTMALNILLVSIRIHGK